MAKVLIGVMGPGANASKTHMTTAYVLGQRIAQAGWGILTGGRQEGVMEAASQGARSAGGLTIGILPTANRTGMSEALDIVICTGLGSARNNVNVLSSDVVVACGLGPGTVSEIALALKAGKPLVLLQIPPEDRAFFERLIPTPIAAAETVDEAIDHIQRHLNQSSLANEGDRD